MTPGLRNIRSTLISLILTSASPAVVGAQVVPLRTVPLPAGEQFLVVPSRNLGMAGASLALDDPWQDPFVNPALGARNEALRIFALPTFYGADGQAGGGASLPVAFLARRGRIFGGGGFAYQAADDPNANYYSWQLTGPGAPPPDLGPPSNRYAYGLLGWTLGDGRTSIGAAVSGAQLEEISAVERLYEGRTWLAEGGQTRDYRVGVLRELARGGSVEAVLLNSRIDMRYDVGRVAWFYDPVSHLSQTRNWTDRNLDRSSTWGAYFRYLTGRDTAGYRTGYSFTVNRKGYPSLPNYDVAPVPRDPGESWAFSAAIASSRTWGKRTATFEAALEPAWSHTWAMTPTQLDSMGSVVPPARTSENWFRFINAHALAGLERRTDWGVWQLGLRLDEIHYSLERQNYQTGLGTNGSDGWFEYSPTWGLMLRAGRAEIRYAGHFVSNDLPCLDCETKTVVQPPPADGSPDYLPPVVGGSNRHFWSAVHQITVSLPLGQRKESAPVPAPRGN